MSQDLSTHEHTERILKRAFLYIWFLGEGELTPGEGMDVLQDMEVELRGWDRAWLRDFHKGRITIKEYEDMMLQKRNKT